MSEQDKRLCQAVWPPHGAGLCGRPAVWRYQSASGLPYLICEECMTTRFATPWMQRRFTRLDATEGAHVVD